MPFHLDYDLTALTRHTADYISSQTRVQQLKCFSNIWAYRKLYFFSNEIQRRRPVAKATLPQIVLLLKRNTMPPTSCQSDRTANCTSSQTKYNAADQLPKQPYCKLYFFSNEIQCRSPVAKQLYRKLYFFSNEIQCRRPVAKATVLQIVLLLKPFIQRCFRNYNSNSVNCEISL
ncbi:hypothetical protein SAMN05660909_00122 [Chitinophaga terrae (ex Kim and Jung 2007)]|uniref:Uncharacterized protein n=1 Tax=Chitinophaga terrae (ex Kim and Jung 2007) TaxID=408074 RepID=A0A1H3WWI9_9BACT|nr:hypothetical protein SAMN05660909_00122 [Chitinophaga terrae (ex Kim and Jung 2007)]